MEGCEEGNLTGCNNLKELNCAGTGLSIVTLKGGTKLAILDLNATKVTEIEPEILPNLKVLAIASNQYSQNFDFIKSCVN